LRVWRTDVALGINKGSQLNTILRSFIAILMLAQVALSQNESETGPSGSDVPRADTRDPVAPETAGTGSTSGDTVAADDKVDPAMDLYYTANSLYNRKLYRLAQDQYQEFLDTYPEHENTKQVKVGLALSTFARGDFATAQPLLGELASEQSTPNRDYILWLNARALGEIGELERAEKAYQNGVTQAIGSQYSDQLKAGWLETMFRQKKWRALSEASRETLAELPPELSGRARYQAAFAERELGNSTASLELMAPLREIGDDDPLAPFLHFLRAECKRDLSEFDEALASYQRTANLESPFKVRASYYAGITLLQQEKLTAAQIQLETTRALLTKNPDPEMEKSVVVALGRCAYMQEDFEYATELLTPMINTPGVGEEASLWLARTHVKNSDWAKAEAVLGQARSNATADHESLPEILIDLGEAMMAQKKHEAAANVYAEFRTRFPEHPRAVDAALNRAYAFHYAGNYIESETECANWLTRFGGGSEEAEIRFLQAENLYRQQKAEALTAFETFISDYPESSQVPTARYRTAQLYVDNENWSKADAVLGPLLENPSDDPNLEGVFYLAGAGAYKRGEWSTAVAHLERYLKQGPNPANTGTATLTLAMAQEQLGATNKAMRVLQPLIDAKPTTQDERDLHAHVLSELGRLRYDAGQASAAREVLERVHREYPKSEHVPSAGYYLAWLDASEGDSLRASERFGEIAALHPTHKYAADSRLEQGILLSDLGKHEIAKPVLEQFLKDHSGHVRSDEGMYYLGLCIAEEKQWSKAAKLFEQLRVVNADSDLIPAALYEEAWCAKNLNETNTARVLYRELIDRYEENPLAQSARFELGELDLANGTLENAEALFKDMMANARNPGLRSRAAFRLGTLYMKQTKFSAAAEVFEELNRSNPANEFVAEAAFQAGESRLALKQHAEALGQFEYSLESAPPMSIRPNLLLRLGRTRAMLKRWDDSEKAYSEFLGTWPTHPQQGVAHFGIGWNAENKKKYKEAVNSYKQVLKQNRRDEISARSQFQIGECMTAMKNYDEAVKAYVKVDVSYGFEEWRAKALLQLSKVLEAQGENESAIQVAGELMQNFPGTAAADQAQQILNRLNK